MGLIKRILGSDVHIDIKNLCYMALVRPLVEYNSVLWSPSNKTLINMIESIQRKASKYITEEFDIEYNVSLQLCDLLPLSLHRDFMDII